MKIMTLVVAVILSFSVGATSASAANYHAPAHNAYQNNWMNGG